MPHPSAIDTACLASPTPIYAGEFRESAVRVHREYNADDLEQRELTDLDAASRAERVPA